MKTLLLGLALLGVGVFLLVGCSSSVGDALEDTLPMSGEEVRETASEVVSRALSGDWVRSAGGIVSLVLGAILTAMGGTTALSRRRRAVPIAETKLKKAKARQKRA